MEVKKTPEADLEKGRSTFFLMGFAVVLSSFFVMMEWQSFEETNSGWTNIVPVFVESEFTGAPHTEKYIPDVSNEINQTEIIQPVISKPEIVYEDYVTTKEVLPEIEESKETDIQTIDTRIVVQPIQLTRIEIRIPVETKKESEPAVQPDAMPQFPGGQTALVRFIYNNTQYPTVALKQRIEGRVWCSFIVEADGKISNIRLEEGVYTFLDDEALRVLNLMPDWIPGRTNGENVPVKVYIPVVFKR